MIFFFRNFQGPTQDPFIWSSIKNKTIDEGKEVLLAASQKSQSTETNDVDISGL